MFFTNKTNINTHQEKRKGPRPQLARNDKASGTH